MKTLLLKYRICSSFIIMTCLLYGCQNTTEIVYPDTIASVTILDDQGQPLPGAQVRLFDNESSFTRAKVRGDYSGEVRSVTTNESGVVVFDKLNHESSYYFFANFRDRSRLVDLENFNESFRFPGFIPRGSKTDIRIQLKRADNVISFFALPENEFFLPIDIFLDGDSIGRISEVVQRAPEGPNISGTISFRMRSGVTKWYARSPGGCVWTGEFSLTGAQSFVAQELQRCESGSISFWTSSENNASLPITVRLGAIDNFGTLRSAAPVTPSACFSGNTLSGNREAGTYEYIAVSADKSCSWTGTFSLTDGDCKIIYLSDCE